jgi:TfoX/Sxy family transcriptional regulator of competence genes
MKWRKSPEELVAAFDSVMPGAPAVMRKMFGCPAGFIHGNMFMSLHQEDMILRLPDKSRTELLAIEGARLFEPMPGRPMREYVVVPVSIVHDPEKLGQWVSKALEYATSLQPKTKKKSAKMSRPFSPNTLSTTFPSRPT